MLGIWYSVDGKGCEHWHEHIDRPDGTGFWAAISRCGMSSALPSLLKDKFNWRRENPKAPRIEGRRCRSCERWKVADKKWIEKQEEEKRGTKTKVVVTFNFNTQERKALAAHRGKATLLEQADLRQWVEMTIRTALDDIIYEVAKRDD
jgi:hypothetical protein